MEQNRGQHDSRFLAGLTETKIAPALACFGLAASVLLGAWWMLQAVLAGEVGAVIIRMIIAVMAGLYYLAVLRLSLGLPLFSDRSESRP